MVTSSPKYAFLTLRYIFEACQKQKMAHLQLKFAVVSLLDREADMGLREILPLA